MSQQFIAICYLMFGVIVPLPNSQAGHGGVMPPDEDSRAGFLSAYSDGVMDRVIDSNDVENFTGWAGYEAREAAGVDGYVAVAHCGRRGEFATMVIDGRSYRVLAVDCIAGEHRTADNMFVRDVAYIAEVDYALGVALGVGAKSVYAYLEFD